MKQSNGSRPVLLLVWVGSSTPSSESKEGRSLGVLLRMSGEVGLKNVVDGIYVSIKGRVVTGMRCTCGNCHRHFTL